MSLPPDICLANKGFPDTPEKPSPERTSGHLSFLPTPGVFRRPRELR